MKYNFHAAPLDPFDAHSLAAPLTSRRAFLSLLCTHAMAQQPSDLAERFRRISAEAERKGLAEPFKGITTDGAGNYSI